jgi:hypothetical protein
VQSECQQQGLKGDARLMTGVPLYCKCLSWLFIRTASEYAQPLQRPQERDQVGLFLVREAYAKALVVEIEAVLRSFAEPLWK